MLTDRTRPAHTDRKRKSRGQSLVELALILPVLLVFLAAALDLGRIFYAQVSLRNAAREGALQASKTPTSYIKDGACDTATNLVVCRVILEAKGGTLVIQPTDIDLTCSVIGCPDQAGSQVTVAVRGKFTLVTPLLSAIFGGQTLDFSSEATAQIEYLPQNTTATAPPGPVANFTTNPDPAEGEAPLTVTFTDTSTDATQWSWDFGDGDTSTEQNPPPQDYDAPGSYVVTLTAINVTGVDIEQRTIVVSAPSASASASASASPSSSPTTAPSCFPPNVIGKDPVLASQLITNAGFTPQSIGDLSTGPKNKVQAQNPDHTQCLAPGWPISFHYRPN
jgi:hypothetical protein